MLYSRSGAAPWPVCGPLLFIVASPVGQTGPVDNTKLLGASEVRELAARLDLRPTKSLGQNFVIDANTVRRIVRSRGRRVTRCSRSVRGWAP